MATKITIRACPTADSRTCDPKTVTRAELRRSSEMHIADVNACMRQVAAQLLEASVDHDWDKLEHIGDFHAEFVDGFPRAYAGGTWMGEHLKRNRHHLDRPEGVPDDVDLVDVLEHVVDCVAAGMARSGKVYAPSLPDALLQRALANTVEKLKSSIELIGAAKTEEAK